MISEAKASERLQFVCRLLQNRHAYLSAAVARLGTVHLSNQCSTAAISVAGTEVRLTFNPEFMAPLTNLELAGVLVHEAMHFLLRHPERLAEIVDQSDRFLFRLACDAVINDLIRASYPDLQLPGQPVTGIVLVGQDVSNQSAEEVLCTLRKKAGEPAGYGWLAQLGSLSTLDDHEPWSHCPDADGASPPPWDAASSRLVDTLLERFGAHDCAVGNFPLGRERLLKAGPQPRADLSHFLHDTIAERTEQRCVWARPPTNLHAVYPRVILPSHDEDPCWRVLMAIDASGSIPDSFAAAALCLSRQPLAGTEVTLVSFDTEVYDVPPGAMALRGGGGTRIQAVEDYLVQEPDPYPDLVFAFTDGLTPMPKISHPARWVWILPRWGSTDAVPVGCRVDFFA